MTAYLWHFNLERPKLSLTCYFVAWKLLLLATALASPGPGYDTSTSLATRPYPINEDSPSAWSIVDKLTRWDAIYFTQIAHGGFTFEQQWMAGWGFTKLLGLFSSFETLLLPTTLTAAVGIVVAHASHLLSVLILHDLGLISLGGFPQPKRSLMASLAACLHIISPAGIFLSAPYAESLFSLMTFLGFCLYGRSLSRRVGRQELQRDILLISSGLCLGLATTVRANGLLNGLIFLYEAVSCVCPLVLRKTYQQNIDGRHLCIVLFSGALMGCIAILPQFLAYLEYCIPSPKRPWCLKWIPSIYTWVQSEYW